MVFVWHEYKIENLSWDFIWKLLRIELKKKGFWEEKCLFKFQNKMRPKLTQTRPNWINWKPGFNI